MSKGYLAVVDPNGNFVNKWLEFHSTDGMVSVLLRVRGEPPCQPVVIDKESAKVVWKTLVGTGLFVKREPKAPAKASLTDMV